MPASQKIQICINDPAKDPAKDPIIVAANLQIITCFSAYESTHLIKILILLYNYM